MLVHAGGSVNWAPSRIEPEEPARKRSRQHLDVPESSRPSAVPWPGQPQNHAEGGLCKDFQVGN
jgi:hypothetical protein